MISLLLLSMVLSTPVSASQTTVAGDWLVAESPRQVFLNSELPVTVEEQQARPFDAMDIRPDSDIFFYIRAYIFSAGPVPKLMKETTCGPKRGSLKSIDGAKPKLVPIGATGDTTRGTASPR